MKIEVFKEYDGKLRLFDAINPDYISWMFDSENRRDGSTAPPYRNESYVNDLKPLDEDLPGTIYFDSLEGDTRVYSTQKNVILDYSKPALVSYTGTFSTFADTDDRRLWKVQLLIRDNSGLDSGAYELTCEAGTIASFNRKNGTAPYWQSTGTILDGVSVRFTRSDIDKTLYKIDITIDQDSGSVSEILENCNPFVSYLRLTFSLYDIAGNQLTGTIPEHFVRYNVSKREFLDKLKRLKMEFVDPYPANLYVDEDTIGKVTISVYNDNDGLTGHGFHVNVGLKSDSVGYLSGQTQEDLESGISIQLVDGIDRSGFVRAYAYLDGSLTIRDCEIEGKLIDLDLDDDLRSEIAAKTRVERDFGAFITECEDNKRKIYVDPFVPSVLKNEGIFGLCKLFEKYLNSMYKSMNGDCRIGILEKIHRISEFKNPDACEPSLLPNFAEEHGSELKFNYRDVLNVAKILSSYSGTDLKVSNEKLAEMIYRRFYSILPYVNRWKGTDRSIELLYRVLGIDAKLIPLWENPKIRNSFAPEDRASDDYQLSTHLELALESSLYSNEDMRRLSAFSLAAVKSLLPVNRVIEAVSIYDKFITDSELNIMHTIDVKRLDPIEKEKISFGWKCTSMTPITSYSDEGFDLEIPIYQDYTYTAHDRALSKSWPIPENSQYYFMRFRETLNTYARSLPIYLSLSTMGGGELVPTGIDINFSVSAIEMRRNRLVLKCDRSDRNLINVFNSNCLDPDKYFAISFLFSRAEDDYCMPVTLQDFIDCADRETPYDQEAE
jgi:hypothetical protein